MTLRHSDAATDLFGALRRRGCEVLSTCEAINFGDENEAPRETEALQFQVDNRLAFRAPRKKLAKTGTGAIFLTSATKSKVYGVTPLAHVWVAQTSIRK